jgi:hypothetical protein
VVIINHKKNYYPYSYRACYQAFSERIRAECGIDIRALSIADTTNFGILRLIVSNPEKAEAALKAGGLTVSRTQVIAVRIEDRPVSLYEVLKVLKREGISV